MEYAVVQELPEPVAVHDLAVAFEALPELTKIDAHNMARDAFGVIVDRLTEAKARTLCRELEARGVRVRAVRMTELPPLPPAKRLRRIDVETSALVMYDPLNRPVQIAWERVRLLAAGQVTVSEYENRRSAIPNYGGDTGMGGSINLYNPGNYGGREVSADRFLLEVQLDVAPYRYLLRGHEANYNTLGSRHSSVESRNFLELVGLLVLHAPHAWFNRGIHTLPHDPADFTQYPSRHAFEEETRWLLWRHLGTSHLEL